MDDEQFEDFTDDGDELEGFSVIHALADDGGERLLTNASDWPDSAWPITAYDIAATTAGLATNIAMAFTIFFRDVRRDLAAARNHDARARSLRDFDRDLLGLPSAPDISG